MRARAAEPESATQIRLLTLWWTRPIYGPVSEPCEASGSSDWLQRPRLPYVVECAKHILAERTARCGVLHYLLRGRRPQTSAGSRCAATPAAGGRCFGA